MTDKSKSVIIAIGAVIAIGLFGIMLRPLSLLFYAIVAGPGALIHGLLGTMLPYGFFLWLIGAIPQFFAIYFIAIYLYRRPLLWGLGIGIIAFLWLLCGYLGWLIIK